jgi:spoIIIJ-associated protein
MKPIDDVFERAQRFLGEILSRMGVDVQVSGRVEGEAVVLDLDGPEVGLVIGRQGRTLDALQQLLVRALLRDGGAGVGIRVDAQGYRARRNETLERMAERTAQTVRESGRPARLANLTPGERRVVHAAAGRIAGVRTRSEGEGEARVLIIEPAGEDL